MSKHPRPEIAAAIVRRPDGRVLLLKRAASRTTNPNKWCFVTGYIEENESPREAAQRELHEELGIDASPVRPGDVVVVNTAEGDTLRIYPYLFEVDVPEVKLEREHVAYAWIEPEQVTEYDIVQQLDDDLRAVGLL